MISWCPSTKLSGRKQPMVYKNHGFCRVCVDPGKPRSRAAGLPAAPGAVCAGGVSVAVARSYSERPDGCNGVWAVRGRRLSRLCWQAPFPCKAAQSLTVARLPPACTPGPDSLSAPFTEAPAAGLSCAHHSGFKAAPELKASQQRVKLGFPKVTRARPWSGSGLVHSPCAHGRTANEKVWAAARGLSVTAPSRA